MWKETLFQNVRPTTDNLREVLDKLNEMHSGCIVLGMRAQYRYDKGQWMVTVRIDTEPDDETNIERGRD